MKKSLPVLALVAAALMLASPAVAAPAADSPSSETARIAEFQAFVATHATDYAARDALAMKLFGTHEYVSFGSSPTMVTGAAAARIQAQTAAEVQAAAVRPLVIPTDAFTVTKSIVSAGANYIVTGTWDFRNDWAGQSEPVDLAALEFSMSSCHKFTSYASSTSSETNVSTNLGTLRDGGASTLSPIWNISDYEKGFVSQADHGAVSVAVSQGSCAAPSQIGYQFQYQANQGGGLVSVSVGFGFINASYSAGDYNTTKSTTAGYFTR